MPKARVHRRALCQDDILLEHGTLSDAFRRQRPARHLDLAGHSCSDCRRCENSVSDSRIYCTVLGEAHMARTQVCKFTQNPDTHTHTSRLLDLCTCEGPALSSTQPASGSPSHGPTTHFSPSAVVPFGMHMLLAGRHCTAPHPTNGVTGPHAAKLLAQLYRRS